MMEAASAVDVSVQTNDSPLVLQYPANLLYAQGMLNTTLLQLQQVEFQISQLRGYVHQHQIQPQKRKSVFGREAETSDALFAAAAVLSNVNNVAGVAREARRREAQQGQEDNVFVPGDPAADALARNLQQRMFPLFIKAFLLACCLRAASLDWYIIFLGISVLFAMEYWFLQPRAEATEARAGGAGAEQPGAAGHGQGRAAERFPALRQRFSLLVKVVLIMLLMEVKWSWYAVFFLVSMIYLGGLFDSWIEWFNGGAAATLENQLDALRRNGAAAAPAAGNGNGAAGENGGETQDQSDAPRETEAAAETDGAAPAEAPAAPAAPPAPAPPFWQRFIYQLFVMFFLTLMPWWTPNPRYM